MIYNIEQGHLTNEQILHKANWKSIANIYKRRILSFIHATYTVRKVIMQKYTLYDTSFLEVWYAQHYFVYDREQKNVKLIA